jgi:hypothetical protein
MLLDEIREMKGGVFQLAEVWTAIALETDGCLHNASNGSYLR